ncbi:MAG: hypothetical protein ABDH18_05030 [Aquificaceae bacterium]
MTNDTIKVRATEYALRAQVSLNTVKNRIRAGTLKGAKESDGIWYVYLSQDEWEHLCSMEENLKQSRQSIEKNIEELRSSLEGKLIATYISALMQSQEQKEKLLYELSSLQTLLALKESEILILKKELEKIKQDYLSLEKELEKSKEESKQFAEQTSSLSEKIKKLEQALERAEIECQKKLLEKEQVILAKELEIAKLKQGEST